MHALLTLEGDRQHWSVLGDALEAAGDPRGELVQVMLAREAKPSVELYERERELLALHGAALLGPAFTEDEETPSAGNAESSWQRGFAREVTVRSVEQLEAVLDSKSNRKAFAHLTSVTLALGDGDGWQGCFEGQSALWRHLCVDLSGDTSGDDLELAAVLAALPALETLRLIADPDTGAISLGPALRLRELTLCNVGALEGFEADTFPALEQVRLSGVVAEGVGEVISNSSATRVVLSEVDDEVALASRLHVVRVSEPTSPEYVSTAIAVVGRRVTHAEVKQALASVSGLVQLAVYCGQVDAAALTVLRFHGSSDAQLFPWAAAQAFVQHFGSSTPVATLVLTGGRSPAMCVLSPFALSRQATHYRFDDFARETVSLMLGVDPGASVLQRMLEALDEAEHTTLVGAEDEWLPVLSEIEPSAGPALEQEFDEFDEAAEVALDARTDAYDDLAHNDEARPLTVLVEVEAPDEGEGSARDVEAEDRSGSERSGGLARNEPEPPDVEASGPFAVEPEPHPDGEALIEEEVDEPTCVERADAPGLPDEETVWAEGPVDADDDWSDVLGVDPLIDEAPRIEVDSLTVETCCECTAVATDTCAACDDDVCGACARPASSTSDRVLCPSCRLA